MKGIICTQPGQLDLVELPDPVAAAGRAILKLKNITVCGTDLHAFEGTQPYFSYPRILGHELSGELVDTGGATGFSMGELVTIIPYFNCNHCLACRNGKPNCCASIQVCGVHVDGAMVQYLSVPGYSLVNNNGLNRLELAMVEPLAIGAHGIRRAGIAADEFVIVIGAGPIGLGTMAFAQMKGAKLIAVDINMQRLDFARQQGFCSYTVQAGMNALEEIRAITSGEMASVVIDASGNQKAINSALQYLGHGGRFVLIGLQAGDLVFPHPEFHKRETTLMSSRNATREDFNVVIEAIRSKKIDPTVFISREVEFGQVPAEFKSWLDPSGNLIKIAINIA